jgi:flagellar export protein FliJ
MAFHFPLQAVFHFRQSVEHQQELRLRTANQQVVRVRHVLDQIDDRIRRTQVRASHELRVGTTSAEVRLALSSEASLRQQRLDTEHELARWQNLRDRQQIIFQQARLERETFESLRDHQLWEYQRDAARREQRQVDDLFLSRQAYLRRG